MGVDILNNERASVAISEQARDGGGVTLGTAAARWDVEVMDVNVVVS